MSRKPSMIAIAATVYALGATGLRIAAFAQQTQAPSMPADLARMAEAAHARMAEAAAQRTQVPSMPADLARMAEATAQQTQAPSMPADLARMAESARARMAEAAPSPESAIRPRELPEYTATGELLLPKNWREWVFVGSPLTPNALNGGHAGFPEYHNVYIEPGSYAIYKKTGVFPDGTIFVKELQLTLPPAEFPDGSQVEPSGRGYFPGAFNGADVTVKDTKRFAATGGWGYFDFNHHEPKAPTAAVQPETNCAFCHIAGAKRDEVWTQFYRILDEVPAPH